MIGSVVGPLNLFAPYNMKIKELVLDPGDNRRLKEAASQTPGGGAMFHNRGPRNL